MAVDAFKRRRELEAQLARNQEAETALQREMENSGEVKRAELQTELLVKKEAQAKLQQELQESQKQVQVAAGAEALQAVETELEQKIKKLTDALGEESKRRERAEKQAGEHGARRRELEAKVAPLGQQLDEAQQRLKAETQLRQQLQEAHGELREFLEFAENQRSNAKPATDGKPPVEATRAELPTTTERRRALSSVRGFVES